MYQQPAESVYPQPSAGAMLPTSSVELTRGTRGGYGWTIKSYATNIFEALREVCDVDAQLRAAYLG